MDDKHLSDFVVGDIRRDFPDDRACLDWLVSANCPDGIVCKKCGVITKHHYVASRKAYSCQWCGHHYHPTANTIYEKSSTPLTSWFIVVYLVMKYGRDINIKLVQETINVTYKTAWRMTTLVTAKYEQVEWGYGLALRYLSEIEEA